MCIAIMIVQTTVHMPAQKVSLVINLQNFSLYHPMFLKRTQIKLLWCLWDPEICCTVCTSKSGCW